VEAVPGAEDYSRQVFAVTPGEALEVTIGTGGSGSQTTGGNGGESKIARGATRSGICRNGVFEAANEKAAWQPGSLFFKGE
jgi:hypothetical protein